jgi:hypothetical protein
MKEKQIGFKTRNGIEIVQLSEIIYCIADGSWILYNYCYQRKIVNRYKKFK